MNTARIVVLTIAVGAGGVTAYRASGSEDKALPTGPVAQLQTANVAKQSELLARPTGTLPQTLGRKSPKGGTI